MAQKPIIASYCIPCQTYAEISSDVIWNLRGDLPAALQLCGFCRRPVFLLAVRDSKCMDGRKVCRTCNGNGLFVRTDTPENECVTACDVCAGYGHVAGTADNPEPGPNIKKLKREINFNVYGQSDPKTAGDVDLAKAAEDIETITDGVMRPEKKQLNRMKEILKMDAAQNKADDKRAKEAMKYLGEFADRGLKKMQGRKWKGFIFSKTQFFRSLLYLLFIPLRWVMLMAITIGGVIIYEGYAGTAVLDMIFLPAALLVLIPVFLLQTKSVMSHDRLEDLIIHIVLFFAYPAHVVFNLAVLDSSMWYFEIGPVLASIFCGYICVRRLHDNV